jgi:predicted HTH domain antitoxin
MISVTIVCMRTMQNARGASRFEYERLHLAATMAAPRHPLRSYIVGLFQRGELVSVAEAVLICDASRQAISKWIKAEGINIETRRLARIAKLTTNAQRYVDGLPPSRKPSKAEMRRDLAKAMRRFNAANQPH